MSNFHRFLINHHDIQQICSWKTAERWIGSLSKTAQVSRQPWFQCERGKGKKKRRGWTVKIPRIWLCASKAFQVFGYLWRLNSWPHMWIEWEAGMLKCCWGCVGRVPAVRNLEVTKGNSLLDHQLWKEFPGGDWLCQVTLLSIMLHEIHCKETEHGKGWGFFVSTFLMDHHTFPFSLWVAWEAQFRQHRQFWGNRIKSFRGSSQCFLQGKASGEVELKKKKKGLTYFHAVFKPAIFKIGHQVSPANHFHQL